VTPATISDEPSGAMRHGVHEIGGAVDRVDDPQVGLVGPLDHAALLAQEAVAGAGLHQQFVEGVLGPDVGGGDEVAGALARHLQLRHLAEVAQHRAGGLADRVDHDGNEGRGEGHGGKLLVRLS
jgi:hypothetical protein